MGVDEVVVTESVVGPFTESVESVEDVDPVVSVEVVPVV